MPVVQPQPQPQLQPQPQPQLQPPALRRWRRAVGGRGGEALLSAGPGLAERLSAKQIARLERELARGPLMHGWPDEWQG